MQIDGFQDHPLLEKLDQLRSRLEETETKDKLEIEKYSFFYSVYKYISDRIRITIPILVQEPEMNALSSEIDAGLQQINSFLGSTNVGNLNNAINNFNSALSRIRNFPLPFSTSDFNFSKSIADFQQIVKEKYDLLEAKSEKIETEQFELKQNLEQKEAELAKLFKLIESKEIEISNLNSAFQTEFANIKSKSNQDFENDRAVFRNEIDLDKKAYENEINALKETISTNSSELVKELNTKLAEAKKIVNVIGNVGVTGNYQIIANEQKVSANLWRWIAIGFMTAFSGLLIWTIIDLSQTDFNWAKSIIRIIAAAALSYPATYASKESSKHRRLEIMNRTAELELASLTPFIELLPIDKQQLIKEKLIEKYFGNNNLENSHQKEEEELSISGFEKIIKSLSPFLKKIPD